jgi:hypothetical protein
MSKYDILNSSIGIHLNIKALYWCHSFKNFATTIIVFNQYIQSIEFMNMIINT